MLYFFTLLSLTLIYIFTTNVTLKAIYDNGWRFEFHFVFFALHLSGKRRRRRTRITARAILGALGEILEKSTVRINRLSVPVNACPRLLDIKYLGVNISYPLIYAYLTANSQRLIISENAVVKETTENFDFLVNISLQTTVFNFIKATSSLLFANKRRKEA